MRGHFNTVDIKIHFEIFAVVEQSPAGECLKIDRCVFLGHLSELLSLAFDLWLSLTRQLLSVFVACASRPTCTAPPSGSNTHKVATQLLDGAHELLHKVLQLSRMERAWNLLLLAMGQQAGRSLTQSCGTKRKLLMLRYDCQTVTQLMLGLNKLLSNMEPYRSQYKFQLSSRCAVKSAQ